MMHRLQLCVLVLFVVVASLVAVPVPAADDPEELLKSLALLREVGQRHFTLEYLGDKRSTEFFKQVIADFPLELKKNFRANITGAYRKEFFANYDAKIADLSRQIADTIAKNPDHELLLFAVLEKSPFPFNLSFATLVKKVADQRQFTVTQAANPTDATGAKASLTKLQAVLTRLAADAKQDKYAAVAAIYKDKALKDFPIWWYDDAQHGNTAYVTEGENPAAPTTPVGPKEWTVLVFINADNDLEGQGLNDINEMEQVGSSDKVNVVVQIDRFARGKGNTITDGNWVGTRRYYVTKDNNKKKVASQLVQNMGETDMGDRQVFADFLSWGVKTYPAKKYCVVVWNHGAGWQGISFDEDSGRHMRMPDVLWALREGQKALPQADGKPAKFNVIDFDACLMGTIETAYELRDVAEYMVASEETEPGSGMPYREYLAPLVSAPTMSPRQLSRNMVAAYVRSYCRGGSAGNKRIEGSSVTKSAYDLSKLEPLVKSVDTLGKQLLAKHDLYADLLVGESETLATIRRYSDETLVDLDDLCRKIGAVSASAAPEIKATCDQIRAQLGYPIGRDHLAEPVTIISTQPANVVWGYNGWRMPPQEIWTPNTRVFHSRMALDPLEQGADGLYTCKIGPFKPVLDPALRKRVFVAQIDYQIVSQDGTYGPKQVAREGKEYCFVASFPTESILVAEGHTQGMGDSRGISIYYPTPDKYITSYGSLLFGRATAWAQFLAKVPTFRRKAPVLLTGRMVNDPMTLPFVARALKANGVKFQVLWNPGIYAYRFRDILGKFAGDGAVITDSLSQASFNQLAPSNTEIADYLDQGGNVFIFGQSLEQNNLHRQMLENCFKFEYVEDIIDSKEVAFANKPDAAKIILNGDDSAQTCDDITIMNTTAPGKVFLADNQGRGTAIAIKAEGASGKPYAGVFMGFRFEAVTGAEVRAELMKAILAVILPPAQQLELFR